MRIGLAGDTMLGRGVAETIARSSSRSLVAPEVIDVAHEADLFVLNLECCISARGSPWPAPGKSFFFRAPPRAVELLNALGVDCVTLANNHVLDFGYDALLDTFAALTEAGIAWVGAGRNVGEARAPVILEAGDHQLAVIGCADHPADYAATPELPGLAYAELDRGVPRWLASAIRDASAEHVLVTPHWGPNMVEAPVGSVRAAAERLRQSGASLVAGHSAHVVHGIEDHVLYDIGDFLDDYATDPILRNDRGLLFLVDLDEQGPRRLEAVPLTLDYCWTCLADPEDARWMRHRFRRACAEFGTSVQDHEGRLVVDWTGS